MAFDGIHVESHGTVSELLIHSPLSKWNPLAHHHLAFKIWLDVTGNEKSNTFVSFPDNTQLWKTAPTLVGFTGC